MADVTESWCYCTDSGDGAPVLCAPHKEIARLLTALRAAEQACGDYFKPPNDLAGAIKNIRQVALSEQGNVDTLQQRVAVLEQACKDVLTALRLEAALFGGGMG